MKTKVCFKCGARKSIDSFYVHRMMADGHLGKCKTCTKKDVAARDPEAVRKYEQKRSQDPERKRQQVANMKKMRLKFPGKFKARSAVQNALRDGRLIKTPCARCGSSDRVQGHHHDYRKKLDVEWLCFRCHWVEHRKK